MTDSQNVAKPLTTGMAFEVGYQRGYEAAIGEAASWLRAHRNEHGGPSFVCRQLADALERGEHQTKDEQ